MNGHDANRIPVAALAAARPPRTFRRAVATGVWLTLLLATVALASDWPQWRGKNRDGLSTEAGWLTNWPPQTVWQRSIGSGVSSVSISEGRLYTMGQEVVGGVSNIVVYCLDAATGTNLWQYSYAAGGPSSYARPCATPTVVSNEVYTFDDYGRLFCFDKVTGNTNWDTTVNIRGPNSKGDWGPSPIYASSPLVEGNVVYVNASGLGAAVSRTTHAVLWPAPGTTNIAGYASALPMTIDSQRVILFMVAGALRALDPLTGNILWSYAYGTGGEYMADPVLYGSQIFLFEKAAALLSPTTSAPNQVYKYTSTSYTSKSTTPVIVGNYAYVVNTAGALVCWDVPNGAVQWTQTGFVAAYPDYRHGPLIAADGKLIILADGKLRVVKASPTGFDEEGRAAVVLSTGTGAGNEIDNFARVLPVLANGRIYCRLNTNLWCFQAGALPPNAKLDSDGDGLNDLEEYAFGSDPNLASSANRPSYAVVEEPIGTRYFAQSYTRRTNSWFTDIVVEVSSNLTSWSSGPAFTTTFQITTNVNGTEAVIERMNTPISSASRGFMRVKVVQK